MTLTAPAPARVTSRSVQQIANTLRAGRHPLAVGRVGDFVLLSDEVLGLGAVRETSAEEVLETTTLTFEYGFPIQPAPHRLSHHCTPRLRPTEASGAVICAISAAREETPIVVVKLDTRNCTVRLLTPRRRRSRHSCSRAPRAR